MDKEKHYQYALEKIQKFCADFQQKELKQFDNVLHYIWCICYEALEEREITK